MFVAVLFLFAALVLLFAIYSGDYLINGRLRDRIEVELLKAENESLDAGRKSWRAECKKRRLQVSELRYNVDRLQTVLDITDEQYGRIWDAFKRVAEERDQLKEEVKLLVKATKKAKK